MSVGGNIPLLTCNVRPRVHFTRIMCPPPPHFQSCSKAYVKNHEVLPHITCIATGVPAPNVTLYSSDTEQKVQIYGAEKINFTLVTMNKFFTGIYHCNASNNVGRMTRSLVVDTIEFKVSDDSESSHSNYNWKSEEPVPFLKTESHTVLLTKSSKSHILYFML